MMLALIVLMALSGWGPSCGPAGCPAVAGPVLMSPAMPLVMLPSASAGAPVAVSRPVPPPRLRKPVPARPVIARKCECAEGSACKGCPDGCACAVPVGDDIPGGVDRTRLSPTPKITRCGKEISRAEAVRAIGQLVDDSQKHRLTVVGGGVADRKALRKSLEAEDWLKPLVLVQDYPEDHWAVRSHPKLGGLGLFLQSSDGTVLYQGLSEPVATLRDKLKRALKLLPPLSPLIQPVIPVKVDLQPLVLPGLAIGIALLLLSNKKK